MSVESLLDWKKIGWRIGKKLKDILDPPDPGPSREERLDQRLRDSLVGLVYFDTFDEVERWKVEDVDPVQQANTPLLERAATQADDAKTLTSRILLCHDYSGGYHDWESVRPSPIAQEVYTCSYPQFVDVFIYFSHKLVCVPPASWINAMHRNGVKVLGTFLVEGDCSGVDRLLDKEAGEYVVAKQLASMAQAYNFDGWLLNIEAEFSPSTREVGAKLAAFIRSLKGSLRDRGLVVWYDALTKNNEVKYQNALNAKNLDFALAADLFFTNYKWSEVELQETKAFAQSHGIRPCEIYFGIDVWAQNTNTSGPPRVTYPRDGGGGTLTGVAVKTLAKHGFSSAIFAPGWSYEHFPNGPCPGTSQAHSVEQSMWEARSLPDVLICDCKGDPHHQAAYKLNPICHAGRDFPAGSRSFLETNFQQALVRSRPPKSSSEVFLSSQAISPSLTQFSAQSVDASLLHVVSEYVDGRPSLVVSRKPCSRPPGPGESVRESSSSSSSSHSARTSPDRLALYKVNMPAMQGLEAVIHYEVLEPTCHWVGLYTRSQCHGIQTDKCLDIAPNRVEGIGEKFAFCDLVSSNEKANLVEMGISVSVLRDISEDTRSLRLYSFVIRPKRSKQDDWTIVNVKRRIRAAGSHSSTRLTWSWQGSLEGWPSGYPWSETTGPFAAFSISIEGEEIGRAYQVEFPIRQEDVKKVADTKMTVKITVKGYLFGGGSVLSTPVSFGIGDLFCKSIE